MILLSLFSPWVYEVNCSTDGGNVGGYKRINKYNGLIEICTSYYNEDGEREHYWEFYGRAENEDETKKIIKLFNDKKQKSLDEHLAYWRLRNEKKKEWAEKQVYRCENGTLKVATKEVNPDE